MLTELLLFLITVLGLNTPGQILSTLSLPNAAQLEKPIFLSITRRETSNLEESKRYLIQKEALTFLSQSHQSKHQRDVFSFILQKTFNLVGFPHSQLIHPGIILKSLQKIQFSEATRKIISQLDIILLAQPAKLLTTKKIEKYDDVVAPVSFFAKDDIPFSVDISYLSLSQIPQDEFASFSASEKNGINILVPEEATNSIADHTKTISLYNSSVRTIPTPVISSASANNSVKVLIPITLTSLNPSYPSRMQPSPVIATKSSPTFTLPFMPANNKVSIPSHVATTNSSIRDLPKTQPSRVIMGINSPTSTPPSIPVQNMASISSSTLASNAKITSSSASLLTNTLKSLSQYASTSQTLPVSSLNSSYKTAMTTLASTTIGPQNTSSPDRKNSLLPPLPQPPVPPAPLKMTKENDPSFELMSGYLSLKTTSLRRSSSVVPPILPAKCQTQDFKRSRSLPVIKKLKVNKCKTDLAAAILIDDEKSQIEEDEPRVRTQMTNHSRCLQQKRNLSPQSFKGMSEQQTFFSFLKKQLSLAKNYDEIEEDQGVAPDHLISASNRLMKKFGHTLGELYIQTEESLKKKKAHKINEFLYASARNIHFQNKLSSKFEFDSKYSGSKKRT